MRKKYVADLTSAVKLDESAGQPHSMQILDQTREEFDKLNDKIKPERDAVIRSGARIGKHSGPSG